MVQLSNNTNVLIGLESVDIVPERPVKLSGQFFMRVSQYVHDPITATVLAIEKKKQDGSNEQVIWISCDLIDVKDILYEKTKAAIEKLIPDFVSQRLIMNATHTHTAPDTVSVDTYGLLRKFFSTGYNGEISDDNVMGGDEYADFFADRVSRAAAEAWEKRAPGGLSWQEDYAVVGHNRRVVYDDGEALMYGNTHTFNFKYLEGPADPRVGILYIWDGSDKLTGVVINIACPSQVVEHSSFISADYWHEVRRQLKETISEDLFVLPMCGAAGDQTPIDLIRISKDNEEELLEWSKQQKAVKRNIDEELIMREIGERICETVKRRLAAARNSISRDFDFRHRIVNLPLPLRTVSRRDGSQAQKTLEEYKKGFAPEKLEFKEMLGLLETLEILDRYEEQERNPFFVAVLHIMRIGDIAIATNPFELFTEYGIRIKAQSCAEQTFISQLSCGKGRYLPTAKAIAGGSYSSAVSSMTTGPDGGDLLVNETVKQINSMWD